MKHQYTFLTDLNTEIDIPEDGTLTRTIHNDNRLKVVLFAFSAGQELSEHTASMPAILHFIKGEADVTLGEDSVAARADTWVHMPPHLPHSIRAKTPAIMLLLLLKTEKKHE